MSKAFTKLIIFTFLLTLAASCVSKKKIIYFQDNSQVVENHQKYALKFKQDDLLAINVSAKNLEAVKVYNLPTVYYSASTNAVNGTPKQQSYLVDSNGEINFPTLGNLKVEGLTRIETIELLKNKLKPFLKDEFQINIQVLNFKINVLGDVSKPGTFFIDNEKVTILDAIAKAGDTNISAERIIEVKRETKNGIETGIIDLRSNALFSSPYYYLQQNDVVYVKPNNAKVQSAAHNQNTGLYISIASVLISLISILTR